MNMKMRLEGGSRAPSGDFRSAVETANRRSERGSHTLVGRGENAQENPLLGGVAAKRQRSRRPPGWSVPDSTTHPSSLKALAPRRRGIVGHFHRSWRRRGGMKTPLKIPLNKGGRKAKPSGGWRFRAAPFAKGGMFSSVMVPHRGMKTPKKWFIGKVGLTGILPHIRPENH